MAKFYFSDFFEVSRSTLEEHGAFNISLINDLPLFIDPFLIFYSDEPEFQKLHDQIIRYMIFLRDKSLQNPDLENGEVKAWFVFKEVKQTWLGFSFTGNKGRGLGIKFGKALHANLRNAFINFGDESITQGSHLERLCLIEDGVGKDNISDFCTVLIKDYLLNFTQSFAQKFIDPRYLKTFAVPRVEFDYRLQKWVSKSFILPYFQNDFVLLTPKRILTKGEIWLNKEDMVSQVLNPFGIISAIDNDEQRASINNYFRLQLPIPPPGKSVTLGEKKKAIKQTIRKFPKLIDYYIRNKEDSGSKAKEQSESNVEDVELMFIHGLSEFIENVIGKTTFYSLETDTPQSVQSRLGQLKHLIESTNSQGIFYVNNQPISSEEDLKRIFILLWRPTKNEILFERLPFAVKSSTNRQITKQIEKIRNLVQSDRAYLSRILKDRLEIKDIKSICFEMKDLEYDDLPEAGKGEKVIELLSKTIRRRQLEQLVNIGQRVRSDIPWIQDELVSELTAIVYFSDSDHRKIKEILYANDIVLNPNIILIDGKLYS